LFGFCPPASARRLLIVNEKLNSLRVEEEQEHLELTRAWNYRSEIDSRRLKLRYVMLIKELCEAQMLPSWVEVRERRFAIFRRVAGIFFFFIISLEQTRWRG
jgi:hypothetical protein